MNTRGQIKNIAMSPSNRRAVVTIEVTAAPQAVERYTGQLLDISIDKHQERRSLQANKFFWACVMDICNALNEDKDKVYFTLLRRYGQYTMLRVPAEAVDKLKKEWRETEVISTEDQDGMVDVLCYFGSHTYTAREFQRLLNGVKWEMEQIGLEPPPDERMRAVIKELEKNEIQLHG